MTIKNVDAFTLLHPMGPIMGPAHGRTFFGTFREHKARLLTYNDLGYNVFFTVNGTDGVGRRAENITRLRCVFADYDNGLPKQFALEPTLLVQSSKGRYQAYWNILGECTDFARWGRIERSLVENSGADRNAQDVARIFRVAGTLNHKYEPSYRTSVSSYSRLLYSLEALSTAFGEAQTHRVAGGVDVPPDLPAPDERLRRWNGWLQTVVRSQGWPSAGNRNGALFAWAAKGVRDFGVDADDVTDTLQAVWDMYEDGGDSRIEQLVQNAMRSASGVVGQAYAAPQIQLLEDDCQ